MVEMDNMSPTACVLRPTVMQAREFGVLRRGTSISSPLCVKRLYGVYFAPVLAPLAAGEWASGVWG